MEAALEFLREGKKEEEGLVLLVSCIVQHKGQRLMCQSLLPGILSFIQNEGICHYGSNNECRTISRDPLFAVPIKELCQVLDISTSLFKEKQSKMVVEIDGSPEIKGLIGTDKRLYLVDLQRVQPRDSNF